MSEEVTNVEQTTVTPVTTEVSTPPVETTEPAKPQTREETIRAALQKANEPKDTDTPEEKAVKESNRGKHAAYQPRADGKFAPGKPQIPVTTEPPKARPAYPHTWKPDYTPKWETLDPDLAEYITQREKEQAEGVKPLLTKAQQADELLKEFTPYDHLLKADNATPQTAIRSLLQTAAVLRTADPLTKAKLVAQTMQQYGVPFEYVQQFFGQGGGQPALDPTVAHLYQTVTQLQQELQSTKQATQQAETQAATRQVESFLAKPEYKYAKELAPSMAQLLEHGMAESMEDAYDKALRLNPQLFDKAMAETRAEADRKAREEATKAAQAARNAAVQVKGAPSSGTQRPPNPADRRALIENALRTAQS